MGVSHFYDSLVSTQQKVVNFAEASQLCWLAHNRQSRPDKRLADKAIKLVAKPFDPGQCAVTACAYRSLQFLGDQSWAELLT